jgi:hypothetical protein
LEVLIMKKRKTALFSFCFLLFFLATSTTAGFAVNVSAATDAIVSPALYVLAEESEMAMAALRGNDIRFEAEDFARALNLSSVDEITVTEVPALTDGELRVGSTVLNRGQTVSGKNLDLLSYAASSDITTSSFRFRVGDAPYEITCRLYLLDKLNHAPTLSTASKNSLNVSTHRNITLYGTLPCYDPDGDKTTIEIVSYPERGILVLTDAASGEYTFTPGKDYAGRDAFTYVARDVYGNYSAAATVSLTVVKPSSSVVFHDIIDEPCYNAALTMAEEGIISGTQIGSFTYFYPDREVSRAEFCVMAMNAIGMTEVTPASSTVFADDATISDGAKGYISTAYELGYIKGLYRGDTLCFEPNRAITRAEAAVLLGNMIGAATPTVAPVFSDADSIPAWAAPSLSSMTAMGIMDAENGHAEPLSAVTRAEAAEMLYELARSVE